MARSPRFPISPPSRGCSYRVSIFQRSPSSRWTSGAAQIGGTHLTGTALVGWASNLKREMLVETTGARGMGSLGGRRRGSKKTRRRDGRREGVEMSQLALLGTRSRRQGTARRAPSEADRFLGRATTWDGDISLVSVHVAKVHRTGLSVARSIGTRSDPISSACKHEGRRGCQGLDAGVQDASELRLRLMEQTWVL